MKRLFVRRLAVPRGITEAYETHPAAARKRFAGTMVDARASAGKETPGAAASASLPWEIRRGLWALRRIVMLSPAILYTTAALMALVAAACTGLCLVWSVAAWRPWLGSAAADVRRPRAVELSGWTARIGSGLVSAGIAACALLAWYGVSCIIAAV